MPRLQALPPRRPPLRPRGEPPWVFGGARHLRPGGLQRAPVNKSFDLWCSQDLSPHFYDVIVNMLSSLRGAFFAGFARGMEATGRCLRTASPHHVLEVGMVCHRAWVRHGLKVTISFFSTCAVSSLGRMDGLVMS